MALVLSCKTCQVLVQSRKKLTIADELVRACCIYLTGSLDIDETTRQSTDSGSGKFVNDDSNMSFGDLKQEDSNDTNMSAGRSYSQYTGRLFTAVSVMLITIIPPPYK